jgi:hypothetical protein
MKGGGDHLLRGHFVPHETRKLIVGKIVIVEEFSQTSGLRVSVEGGREERRAGPQIGDDSERDHDQPFQVESVAGILPAGGETASWLTAHPIG